MANSFKKFFSDALGIQTKEDKEKERQELLKNEGEMAFMTEQEPTSDEKKKEKEKVWANLNQDYEYVCQGGTVMCKYHSAGDAKLMPTSTEVMLQDKPYVTEADTDGKTNFVFTGLCTHSSHGSKKPPCKAVINLGKWKNCSTSHIDDYHPILFKSSIPCMISGEDLKVTNSGQVNRPDCVEPDCKNKTLRIVKREGVE